ncbi:DNA ligase/mRNA capping enzyme [Vararia minispora EC-137]|uniref:DNA ligase/mRNA capping enzyme n=1 Tax=Vararia minispora EC-137 TaxID=1314806 RepID=A0ACB8QBU0_9AGAM|nr:DNA ligase/mRNA capping enzyme [Vararia minispora EC-137]
MSNDELSEISGVKPKVLLVDGDEREVSSMTSSSKYKIKRTWDHYYCTCPAWRNQSRVPTNARTCKHLKALLGDEYEDARVKWKDPDGYAERSKGKAPAKGKPGSKGKPASNGKRSTKTGSKRKQDNDNDAGDHDVGKPAEKRRKVDAVDEDKEYEEVAGKAKVDVLLAVKWDVDTGPDPAGWWVSEKLDGVRTFYDGRSMYSRVGNPFIPPKWFLEKLPKDVTLDGELFAGRGKFQDAVSIVKTRNSPHWKDITFQVFDIPSSGTKPFEDRIKELQALFGPDGKWACEEVVVVEHEQVRDRQHVLDKLKDIEKLGGEGLMLRKPMSQYEGRRSNTMLKVKTFFDAEAVVVGYEPGKGRHKGVTGSLKCRMESGKTFNVGTGLSDKQRQNPPKIGEIIVYRFQEFTRDGVPRFPSYQGEAVDKTKPKDAEVPKHRKPGAATDDV